MYIRWRGPNNGYISWGEIAITSTHARDIPLGGHIPFDEDLGTIQDVYGSSLRRKTYDGLEGPAQLTGAHALSPLLGLAHKPHLPPCTNGITLDTTGHTSGAYKSDSTILSPP